VFNKNCKYGGVLHQASSIVILLFIFIFSKNVIASSLCSEFIDNFKSDSIEISLEFPKFLKVPEGTKLVSVKPEKPIQCGDKLGGVFGRLNQLRNVIRERFFIQGKSPEIALYLATGVDGGLSHALVPEAKVHITIDDSPPFNPREIDFEKTVEDYLGYGKADWPFVQGGLSGRYSGPDLIANIITNLSTDARIRELIFMIPPNEFVSKMSSHAEPAVHLLLVYDRGEGSAINFHWHIHGQVPVSIGETKNIWWFKILEQIKPSAIMTKANSGAISKSMANEFRTWASLNEGFVLSDGMDLIDPSDQIESLLIDGGFGYNSGAYISKPKQ
jgi:hypothetical protein